MNIRLVVLLACFVMIAACRTSRDVCVVEERQDKEQLFSLLAARHAASIFAAADIEDTIFFYSLDYSFHNCFSDSLFQDDIATPSLGNDGVALSPAVGVVRHRHVKVSSQETDTAAASITTSARKDMTFHAQSSSQVPRSFSSVRLAALWFVLFLSLASFSFLAIRFLFKKL